MMKITQFSKKFKCVKIVPCDILVCNYLLVAYVLYTLCISTHLKAHEIINTSFLNHPRLIWKSDEETMVRDLIDRDSLFCKVHKNILRKGNKILTSPNLVRKMEGKRLLSIAREARQRIIILSYAYRMTEEIKYAERAIEEMLNVCRFSDWNPSHFLDVAELTMGVAIGFDWLFDVINNDQRNEIVHSLYEKSIQLSNDNRYSGFYNVSSNWNSVCNAGLVFGTISVCEDFPYEMQYVIDRCLDSNPKVLNAYAPDGGYPEGCGYWGYGTSFEVLLIDALSQVYGHDFGLSKHSGFLQSARFMQFMTAPSGMCFNFGDSSSSMPLHAVYWWFVNKCNDQSLLKFINNKFQNNIYDLGDKGFLPFALIYASRLNESRNSDVAIDENFWFSRGITPVFAYRQGWDSSNDAYLAVKGGSASTTHAHMDAGSFVYEYNGIRWAIDLGCQNYYSIEKEGVNLWDMTQNSPRWGVERLRNDFHNTLTIDGERHIANAKAEIVDTFASPVKKGALVNLTSTLGKVDSALRTIFLDKDNHLHIIDSISANNEVKLKWVMVTASKPSKIDKHSIILEENGKKMIMTIKSSLDVESHIWSNLPLHHYDESNSGTYRVGYTVKIPSKFKEGIHVIVRDY